jgi:flagellar FliL protein
MAEEPKEETSAEGEEKAPKEEKKKKDLGGLIKLLSLIAGILILIIIVIVVASNVAKKSIEPPDEEFEPEKVEEESHHKIEKPLYDYYIGDFTARLADIDEPHYVKISDLVLKYDPIKYKMLAAEIAERESEIKDIINTILIGKTVEINSPKGKEELKQEILAEINEILIEGQIPAVHFQLIVQ